MIRVLNHIGVHVRDLDRMAAFYREAFGFAAVAEELSWRDNPKIDRMIDVPGSAARMLMLRTGNCYLELFEYSAPEGGSTRPLDPFDKGYTHLCIEISDFASEFERLKGLGMTFGSPEPNETARAIAIYGRDPEGHLIELMEPKPGFTGSVAALAETAHDL